ncbi:MAG: TetR/AcrR family transcriptional regulator [Acidimicrobiales bacterium]
MRVESGDRVTRPLRADAARNREKILRAAGTVFAQRGLDATLDDVASAADVGVATVYRRFADKEALVTALFESAIDEIAALAVTARDYENSWDGLVWFLEEVIGRQCADRGLRDVVVGTPYDRDWVTAAKQRLGVAVAALLERAQRDGYLRRDVVVADVAVLEMMISSLGSAAAQVAPDLWRRYLALILDGLAATDSRSLPAVPADEVVFAALRTPTVVRPRSLTPPAGR